jgi:hypothetical protein
MFGLFLVFGAIKAPLSKVDDRCQLHPVTTLSRNFVTEDRAGRSLSMVWIALTLHG